METYEIIDRLSASLEEVEDREFSGSEITEYCIQFCSHPDLKEYDLSRQDCIITAHIWQSTVKDSGCDKALDLLKLFYDETHLQIKNLDIVISLVNRNVLFIPDLSIKCSAGFYERKDIPALKKADIIDERVDMHPDFLRLLLGEKTSDSSAKTMHYKDNNEFLDDWINYVTMIDDLKTGRHSTFFDGDEMDQDDIQNLINIETKKNQIYEKMQITKHKFPLIEMIDQYQLDHKDVLILIYLLKQKLEDKSCDSDDVMKLISSNHLELFSNRKYLNKSSRLVKNNLISVSEERAFMATSIVVSITNSALRRILMSKALSDEEKLAQIMDDNDIFTLIDPQQTFDDLVLSDEMKATINYSLQQYNENVSATLMEWGLFDKTFESAHNVKKLEEPGMLMLFYGIPGTGKTFAAGAIANALGKKLLVTDISRIQSKWVGDSEKNVKALFNTFQMIVNQLDNPPVLLFNEADQFLIKRLTNVESAIENMLNSMQNLFLEAFENLRGVLIATTNMRENLDEAFSRRFNLKLNFTTPSAEERIRLWKLHLPDTIPGADKINIKLLAKDFHLTGGQIKIIVRNACIEAASRKEKCLTDSDLIKYCSIETGSNFDKTQRKAIGF